MTPQIAPYGSWKSPITAEMTIAGKNVADPIGFGQIALDGQDVYWIESRPQEQGRSVVMQRKADGTVVERTPVPFNVRTRVHEYGGGAFTVNDGVVYFSNFADQRLYRVAQGGMPETITPEGAWRYADGTVDAQRNRMICVREDHTVAGREAVNTLVSVVLDGSGETRVLVSGNDFYSSPRLSPDGSHLAWLTWNHPNMPWDGTELWVGELNADGLMERAERVAGGVDESIFQPEWSPDGVLYFISDRSGWWNLYRWEDGEGVALYEKAAEFGEPQWVFGLSTYAFAGTERIVCTYTENSITYLASLDTVTGAIERIDLPYTSMWQVRAQPGYAVFVYGTPSEEPSLVRLDLDSLQIEVLKSFGQVEVDSGYLSMPQAIEFPTEGGLTAYAFFYPPKNRDYIAPEGELPPLVVKSHGGPTGATYGLLRLDVQYWTSRGLAVLDVNYGGSTGYGRAYRQRLQGQWGIVDVDDCVNGAKYLVEQGLVDEKRLAIRGGSAGGYTTLCALTFRDVFKAGASHYGISDLEILARDTHKFESRYTDRLVGPYPERRDLYRQRSPIHFTERLSCPVIFFHGLEDKAVPPNQAQMMVDALRAKQLPVAYITYEGEGHGFRRAENIRRTLEAEVYFFSRIFGFALADSVEPVPIENLPS